MAFLDIIIIIIGVIYGYRNPGKEDRIHILKKGLKIGVIFGVLVGLIGLLSGNIFSSVAMGFAGIIGFALVALFISIEFVIGTFIGDYLEEKMKK